MKKMFLVFILLTVTITGCAKSNGGNNDARKVSSNGGGPAVMNTDDGKQTDPAASIPDREYIPPEMSGEITVSVLDDSEIINTAAELFMGKYPDVKVTVNTFRKIETIKLENGAEMGATPSEEFSTENYLSLLNTKIMTGKAEDIFLTDPICERNKRRTEGI